MLYIIRVWLCTQINYIKISIHVINVSLIYIINLIILTNNEQSIHFDFQNAKTFYWFRLLLMKTYCVSVWVLYSSYADKYDFLIISIIK